MHSHIDSETREQRLERFRKHWQDNRQPDDLTPEEMQWVEEWDIGKDDA